MVDTVIAVISPKGSIVEFISNSIVNLPVVLSTATESKTIFPVGLLAVNMSE